jgi:hypothetical protein
MSLVNKIRLQAFLGAAYVLTTVLGLAAPRAQEKPRKRASARVTASARTRRPAAAVVQRQRSTCPS